jgi:hypothetical protein
MVHGMSSLKITIPLRAGHFPTLRLLASLRGQGAPKNLQCALPGSDFQVAQRYRIALRIRRPGKCFKNKGEKEEIYGKI